MTLFQMNNWLKLYLQNDFTTGDDRYPNNRQQTLMLPYKFTKSCVTQQTTSEGTAFYQSGGDEKNRFLHTK